jgi:hypothetical protein
MYSKLFQPDQIFKNIWLHLWPFTSNSKKTSTLTIKEFHFSIQLSSAQFLIKSKLHPYQLGKQFNSNFYFYFRRSLPRPFPKTKEEVNRALQRQSSRKKEENNNKPTENETKFLSHRNKYF